MNRLSLTLGLAAMDLCWVYPWSVLIGLWSGGPGRPLLSPAAVLGMVMLGALTTQALGRYAAHRQSLRLGLAGLGAAAAAGAVRLDQYPGGGLVEWVVPFLSAVALTLGQVSAPVLAFALALYVWWRGVGIGAQQPSFVDVETAFRWGIGLLIAFGLILAITTRPSLLPSLEAQTTPFVVGFFFVSLLTLALGRLESLRSRTRALGLNTQWFGVLLVVAGLVVVAALILGQLLSFNLLTAATRPLFDLLGQLLVLLMYVIVIPLAYVIEWLIYLVLSLINPNTDQPPPQPPQPSDVDDLLQRLFSRVLTPELLVALKALGAAALVLLALVIVSRALKRWRPPGADAAATNEERDSVFDPELLMQLWLDWLRRVLGRRLASGDRAALARGEPGAIAAEEPVSVRALYRKVLRLGDSVGARRASATTALEHLPALRHALEPADGLTDLTDAYLRARYAELDDAPAELAELRDEVARLRPKLGPE
jgi:MFS family permease